MLQIISVVKVMPLLITQCIQFMLLKTPEDILLIAYMYNCQIYILAVFYMIRENNVINKQKGWPPIRTSFSCSSCPNHQIYIRIKTTRPFQLGHRIIIKISFYIFYTTCSFPSYTKQKVQGRCKYIFKDGKWISPVGLLSLKHKKYRRGNIHFFYVGFRTMKTSTYCCRAAFPIVGGDKNPRQLYFILYLFYLFYILSTLYFILYLFCTVLISGVRIP